MLNFDIRPSLLESWQFAAMYAGFVLGELVEVDNTELYFVKAFDDPDLDYIPFTWSYVKKYGAPGQSVTTINVTVHSKAIQSLLRVKNPT